MPIENTNLSNVAVAVADGLRAELLAQVMHLERSGAVSEWELNNHPDIVIGVALEKIAHQHTRGNASMYKNLQRF